MKRCIKCNQDDWSVRKENIDVYSEDVLTDFVQDALEPLGWTSEPSTQMGQGADFVYNENGDLLVTVDYGRELEDFDDLLDESDSREDFVGSIRNWFKVMAGL